MEIGLKALDESQTGESNRQLLSDDTLPILDRKLVEIVQYSLSLQGLRNEGLSTECPRKASYF